MDPFDFATPKDDAGRHPLFPMPASQRSQHYTTHHCAKDSNEWMPRPSHPQAASETDSESMPSLSSPISDSDTLLFAHYAQDAALLQLAMDSCDSDSIDTMYKESMEPTQLTAEERRQRRNKRERLRVLGVQKLLDKLRDDLAKLQLKHEELLLGLQARRQMTTESAWNLGLSMKSDKLDPDGSDSDWFKHEPANGSGDSSYDAMILQRYVALVEETKQLRATKLMLEDELRPLSTQTTVVTTLLQQQPDCRFAPNKAFRNQPLEANGSSAKEVTREQPTAMASDNMAAVVANTNTNTNTATATTPSQPNRNLNPTERPKAHAPHIVDPILLMEQWLARDPLTPAEATALVEETCREMMQAQAETQPGWGDSAEAFGWSCKSRTDLDGARLQFKLSQTFAGMGAHVLMQKTWHMLTDLHEYRRIQPQTQQLRVLQRVSDECFVVGLAVGAHSVRQSLILVARAIIHGGFLITFRSLPLVRKHRDGNEEGRRQFIEHETGGMYVDIFSWYNFQERPAAGGGSGGACDVIFGGTARNGNTHYLKQLEVEVLSGISHWQSALGFPWFQFPVALSDVAGRGAGRHETGAGARPGPSDQEQPVGKQLLVVQSDVTPERAHMPIR